MLVCMKAIFAGTLMAAAVLFAGSNVQAQYKAPSQYFRKDSPGQPGKPATPAPAVPPQPKFKDLPVNTGFFFLSDTNRAYAWTKISDTTAKNTKNGITQTINADIPVQR